MKYEDILAAFQQASGFDLYRLQEGPQPYWGIPYVAINLDGADVKIRESGRSGLSRHEVAVGETVGFLDQERRQRHGQIIRLNDKTVTLLSDGQKWRVSYALLHRVLGDEIQ